MYVSEWQKKKRIPSKRANCKNSLNYFCKVTQSLSNYVTIVTGNQSINQSIRFSKYFISHNKSANVALWGWEKKKKSNREGEGERERESIFAWFLLEKWKVARVFPSKEQKEKDIHYQKKNKIKNQPNNKTNTSTIGHKRKKQTRKIKVG